MGTDCAPLPGDIFLYSYEAKIHTVFDRAVSFAIPFTKVTISISLSQTSCS